MNQVSAADLPPPFESGIARADLCISVTDSKKPAPVLCKAAHVDIMKGHRLVETDEVGSLITQESVAQISLLACEQGTVEATRSAECVAPEHSDSSARLHTPGRKIPVMMCPEIVQACARRDFFKASEYAGHADIVQYINSLPKPRPVVNRIAVKELDKLVTGCVKTRVSRRCGGRSLGMYGDDLGTEFCGNCTAIIDRIRVDVDQLELVLGVVGSPDRLQATYESLPFVPADDHNANGWKFLCHRGRLYAQLGGRFRLTSISPNSLLDLAPASLAHSAIRPMPSSSPTVFRSPKTRRTFSWSA